MQTLIDSLTEQLHAERDQHANTKQSLDYAMQQQSHYNDNASVTNASLDSSMASR
jgi:chromosome segregation ATPase